MMQKQEIFGEFSDFVVNKILIQVLKSFQTNLQVFEVRIFNVQVFNILGMVGP